jgi:hypothetical protein
MSIVHGCGRVRKSLRNQQNVAKAVVEALESRVLLSYVVTSLADDGSAGTLRYEIEQAEAAGSNQTITFASQLSGMINLSGSALSLNQTGGTLAIDGPGAGVLTISASGLSSAFNVSNGYSAEIDGLTISGARGQGINNQGTLTVSDCTITGNSAGGIQSGSENYGGTLYLSNSTITGNSNDGKGGGIFVYGGSATITDSSITNNNAGHGNGGGIANWYGNVSISDCTISGNSCFFSSGIENYGGSMALTNSTLSGNSAGPALVNGDGCAATVTDCTISGNADGGIKDDGSTVYLYGTIVANNSAVDLNGSFAGTYNLIGDGSGGLTSPTNILNRNPDLASLGDNGGPTQTMALMSDSPAIGSSIIFDDSNSNPIVTDQRGDPRSLTNPDMGAFSGPFLVVNTTTDSTSPGAGLLSLSEAIPLAEAGGGDQVITFAPGLSGTIDLDGSPLQLDDTQGTISIFGPGAGTLSINAGGQSNVFDVGYESNAVISGLTITGGKARFNGGGINNGGILTVSDCTIEGNSAAGGGGGIYNSDVLTVKNCSITGNTGNGGGGIENYGYGSNLGYLTVINSTISHNISTSGGGGIGSGGEEDTPTTIIAGCTISGNTANDEKGGGIFIYGGSATITDSSITNNNAGRGNGGGIANWYGNVSISDCTISGNSCSFSSGIENYGGSMALTNSTLSGNSGGPALANGDGCAATVTDCTISGNVDGGIKDDGSTVYLYGTIVANNSAVDLNGSFAGTHNLIGDGSGELSSSTNILDENPDLGPLGNYGGSTQTMSLLPGSPAIGHGSAFGITTDQRGQLRPNSSNGTYDIGAFQTGPIVVNTLVDGPDNYGQLSLRQAINLADVLASAGYNETVTFAPGLSGTIALTQGSLNIGDTAGSVAIDGPGANLLSINAGKHSRVLEIDYYAAATISGLTITGGYADNGAGIQIDGGPGGPPSGILTINDCDIVGNTATQYGGGVSAGSGSNLTIYESTISGNTAGIGPINDPGADRGRGGGVNSYQGNVTVESSTFTGNYSNYEGGAFYAYGLDALVNCTIVGNIARTGGGICNTNDQGQINVTDCTISGNSALVSSGGGGIYGSYGSNFNLNGNIIAGNTNGDLNNTDNGDFSGSYNLIGDGTGGLSAGNHNILPAPGNTINPMLLPLGNYGGSTETMALLPESQAVGASVILDGPDGSPITVDQRGYSRLLDAAPDMGAFQTEPGGEGVTTLTVTTLGDGSTWIPGQLTLREAIDAVNTWGGNHTIDFAPGLTGTIDLNGNSLLLSDSSGTINIQGPGASSLTINSGGSNAVFDFANGSAANISNLTVIDSSGITVPAGSLDVTTVVQASPSPQIQLIIPDQPYDLGYTIYRRIAGSDSSWGNPIASISGVDNSVSFIDTQVSVGTEYEYEIVRSSSTDYLDAGIELPATESMGTVLLVVDSTYAAGLAPYLKVYEQDLIGDGWNVLVNSSFNSESSPTAIRDQIISTYENNPTLNQVVLIGDLPVVYAGPDSPDGHGLTTYGEYFRYFPDDAFYGDMNPSDYGSALQETAYLPNYVYNFDPPGTTVANATQTYLTGSYIPTLAVGRIDMANMGYYENSPTDLSLLQAYFEKDNAFRQAQMEVSQTVVDNNFGEYAENIENSFSTFFGPSGVANQVQWISNPPTGEQGYLFGYGSGMGSPQMAAGFGGSSNFEQSSNGAVFNVLFGSFFGDWNTNYITPYPDPDDSEDFVGAGNTEGVADAFLRSPLAGPGVGLDSIYGDYGGGWPLYTMAMGGTMGGAELYYQEGGPSDSLVGPHVTVMGDPTLTAFPVAPASDVQVAASGSNNVVRWTASSDSTVLGYDIFRSTSLTGTFTQINTAGLVSGTCFTDTTADGGDYIYMVRAVKLEQTASGSFYDLAEGSFSDPTTSASIVGVDSTTGGDWTGTYGSQGYDVIGGSSSLPSDVQLSSGNTLETTPDTGTSNDEALQQSPSSSSTSNQWWVSNTAANNLSVNLDFTDDETHEVSLYFLDWRSSGIDDVVTITDSNTGSILQQINLSSFGGGKYLNLDLSGDVTIVLTSPLGASQSPVLNGIFFDS